MKPPRQLALAVLLWTAHDAAAAATLPIDGNYGDRGGCRFAALAENSGEDEFQLLTPQNVRTAASYCEFKTILKQEETRIRVRTSCQDEGDDAWVDVDADIIRKGQGYEVSFSDGIKLGPLEKCD